MLGYGSSLAQVFLICGSTVTLVQASLGYSYLIYVDEDYSDCWLDVWLQENSCPRGGSEGGGGGARLTSKSAAPELTLDWRQRGKSAQGYSRLLQGTPAHYFRLQLLSGCDCSSAGTRGYNDLAYSNLLLNYCFLIQAAAADLRRGGVADALQIAIVQARSGR